MVPPLLLATVFGLGLLLYLCALHRWLDRSMVALGTPDEVNIYGNMLVFAVIVAVPVLFGAALSAPPALATAGVPMLVALAVVSNNALARRRPDLHLGVLRWPDELRTLRTPVGRVGVATASLAIFVVAAAVLSGR